MAETAPSSYSNELQDSRESMERQFTRWREVMLDRILLFAAILGTFPILWSIINRDRYLFLYIGIYCVAVALYAAKSLGYTVRVAGLLGIIYGVALSEFAYGGITGGARIYLLSIILLAGIFLGLRAGFAVLGISLATIAGVYFLIDGGHIELTGPRAALSEQPYLWVHYVLGLLLMAGCILMPLGSLLQQLVQSLAKSQHLVTQLQRQVDEKEEAQTKLLKSERLYRMVTDNIMDIVWTTDMDLNITFVSPSVTRLTGFDMDDTVGFNLLDGIYRRHRSMVNHLLVSELKRAEADGTRPTDSVSFEMELPHKDGRKLWVESRATFIRDEAGEPIEILGVTRDITSQKTAEAERNHLEIQIRQSEKLKSLGALAGGIAHDFNNILQAIFGYSDLALVHTEDNPAAHEEIDQVKHAAKRAHELVQQILMFGRQGDDEFKLVSLDEIADEVLELLRASLPSTISIDRQVNGSCGPVFANPSQIHQVIVNLCTNAFHAMRENGGTLSIALESEHLNSRQARNFYHLHEGRYIRLTIRDTGHGISPEITDRIFEPFFTTKEVGDGTGLGLSTVHGIVMKHGGEITVDSTLGKGTSFCVYLPEAVGDVISDPSLDGIVPTGQEHVLFVDDEENLVALGERALTQLGYRVTGVTDSEEALALFNSSPDAFQVVLTDQNMPNMTGVELATKLHTVRPHVPVILVSGFLDSVPRESALKLGISTILSKPVRANEMSAAIRSLMDC
jgi:PAS domain S-box-containing protein